MPRRRIHTTRGPLLAPHPRLLAALETLHGDLENPQTVQRIATGMQKLHRGLTTERDTFTGRPYLDEIDVRFAYSTYMLCAQLPKLFPIMDRIFKLAPLPNPLRILEVGCGTGAGVAGMLMWAESRDVNVEIYATDFTQSALLETTRLAQALGFQAPRTGRLDLRKRLSPQLRDVPKPHLILGMNVFNELPRDRITTLAQELKEAFFRHAIFTYIEPASAIASEHVLNLRDRLVETGWHVLAPCTHSDPCPAHQAPGGWCHDVWRFERPSFMAKVDGLVGTRRQSLKATWGILQQKEDVLDVPLKDDLSLRHRARAVSERFEEKGRTRIKVCSAGNLFELELQKRDRSPKNKALCTAERYSLLEYFDGQPVGTAIRLGPDASCEEIHEGLGNLDD